MRGRSTSRRQRWRRRRQQHQRRSGLTVMRQAARALDHAQPPLRPSQASRECRLERHDAIRPPGLVCSPTVRWPQPDLISPAQLFISRRAYRGLFSRPAEPAEPAWPAKLTASSFPLQAVVPGCRSLREQSHDELTNPTRDQHAARNTASLESRNHGLVV
jgi:hypothetical protein